MKKQVVVLCLMSLLLFITQFQTVQALQKTYEWHIPSGIGGPDNIYQVSLITSDSWQVDTTVDITFRLTLMQISSTLDHTETNWVKIVLSSENFIMDSGNQAETVILTNIGDYWEKRVSFNIPAEKLNRGQTLNVTIIFVANMNTIDNIQWKRWEQTTQSYDNPMVVSLSRPALSTLDLIAIVVVAAVVISGISGFILYRRRRFGKNRIERKSPLGQPK